MNKIIKALSEWANAQCIYCGTWYETTTQAAACASACYQKKYG